MNRIRSIKRRRFLQVLTGMATLGVSEMPGAVLAATPGLTEGPFYPGVDHRPDDMDNDLVKLEQHVKEAGGRMLYLTGSVLTPSGVPVSDAYVEIWQCDVNGRYIRSGSAGHSKKDPYFQGFGRASIGNAGQYHFRTIKPVAYQNRTPHIHVKIMTRESVALLTTQIFFQGEPLNDWDPIYSGLSETEKQRLTVEANEVKNRSLISQFDVVVAD